MADPKSTKSLEEESDLRKLTVMEAAELAKALEEEWGASAVAVVAGAGPAAGGGYAIEEKDEFDVILTGDGGKRIQVIKEVRAITGLSLREAMALVEGAPKTLMEGVDKAGAEKIKKKLEGSGATVELESSAASADIELKEFAKIVAQKLQEALLDQPDHHIAFVRNTLAPVMEAS
ncbi:50S ribosomal protein L7/L12 [Alteraurantiacibacter aquimixticola]|uniref:Large ribosomal subunit protein bL12 n=1 Tax=Alteraurantiacibacter aquimixticola TaxID=2489173 RepID=A0A4T3EYC3_9SPHN|nr:50S ribosomal protein L7/L12 [Alteraurantiacibacter aquimixticola]